MEIIGWFGRFNDLMKKKGRLEEEKIGKGEKGAATIGLVFDPSDPTDRTDLLR